MEQDNISLVGSSSRLEGNASELTLDEDYCMDAQSQHLAGIFQFWINGIGVLVIGVPGLIGNFLSAMVLITSEEMKANVFNYLLSGLCLVDSLMIALCMLDHGIVRGFNQHWNW